MHAKYFNSNGNPVPSVTTVLKILYKDGLMEWANYIGRRGIDYKQFLGERATVGSVVHEMVEADLHNREPIVLSTPAIIKEASEITQRFKIANQAFKINNVITELSLSCELFGGTMDLIADMTLDGKQVKILGDFKTSKKPYLTQFIQLGAYLELLKINKPELYNEIQYCMILSITTNKVLVQYVDKESCEKYFTTLFYRLLDVYTLWNDIQKLEPQITKLSSY